MTGEPGGCAPFLWETGICQAGAVLSDGIHIIRLINGMPCKVCNHIRVYNEPDTEGNGRKQLLIKEQCEIDEQYMVKMHKTTLNILRTIYKLPRIYRKTLATC